MNRFGFTEEQMESWRDEPIFLKGSGDAGVVLVHGWSSMPKQMRTLAEKINEFGHWVSVPKLAGHGSSPEDLKDVRYQDWVSDVKAAAEKLKENPSVARIFLIGDSMGGNACTLVSQLIKVDGIVLVGTPVRLKKHFWIWLGTKVLGSFMTYVKKRYPESLSEEARWLKKTSYQYFPISSVKETLKIIKRSVATLNRVECPALVLKAEKDYLVSNYSAYYIYGTIGSQRKEIKLFNLDTNSHNLISKQQPEFYQAIEEFIED